MNWNTVGIGAITGLVAALAVDLQAFRAWKSWDEAKGFDWRIAIFRWAVGAVTGAISGPGATAMMGGGL